MFGYFAESVYHMEMWKHSTHIKVTNENLIVTKYSVNSLYLPSVSKNCVPWAYGFLPVIKCPTLCWESCWIMQMMDGEMSRKPCKLLSQSSHGRTQLEEPQVACRFWKEQILILSICTSLSVSKLMAHNIILWKFYVVEWWHYLSRT